MLLLMQSNLSECIYMLVIHLGVMVVQLCTYIYFRLKFSSNSQMVLCHYIPGA